MIAPIIDCVIETGARGKENRPIETINFDSPVDENRKSTNDADKIAANEETGVNLNILLPTVEIVLCEYVKTPIDIDAAPRRYSCCEAERVNILKTFISINGAEETNTPTTLETLFAPRLYEPNAAATISAALV